jgi:integral membrane protein
MKTPIDRLRVIGFAEGVSYLLLLFIATPLKYLAGWPYATMVLGTIHGGLFVLFVLSVIEVTIRRPWWSGKFWFFAGLAAILPFGTFVFDGWVRRVEEGRSAAPRG